MHAPPSPLATAITRAIIPRADQNAEARTRTLVFARGLSPAVRAWFPKGRKKRFVEAERGVRRSKNPQRDRQITRRERRKGLLSATTSRDRGWLEDQVFAWLARSNTQVSGGSVLVPEHRHHGETP